MQINELHLFSALKDLIFINLSINNDSKQPGILIGFWAEIIFRHEIPEIIILKKSSIEPIDVK